MGKQELAAEFFLGLVEVDGGAALGEFEGGGHARRAATHDGIAAFEALWGGLGEFGFAAGARVDHAARHLALEGAVQARLVARDAGVDLAFPTIDGLGDDVAVGEPGARHRNEVRAAVGQHLLGHLRHVDAVGGHQRHAHLAHQLLGHPSESRAGHHGGDRGDARLVPADARVDDVGAGGLDDLRLLHHLAPAVALLHEVEHAQAVHDGKVGAAGLADARDDLFRKPHPVGEVAAPLVGPVVGAAAPETG